MSVKPTLFFDVGGVLLTNAWDTPARKRGVEKFGLDLVEYETRHGMLKTAFETGKMSLNTYLRKSIFHRSRPFSPEDVKAFMYTQSQVLGDSLEWLRGLAAQKKYRLFTLNNESAELHEYRVRTFRLDEIFDGFLTSCYLGVPKPDEQIYTSALGIAAVDREHAIFIDDRSLNVEPAIALGLRAIHYQGLEGLRAALREQGVEA